MVPDDIPWGVGVLDPTTSFPYGFHGAAPRSDLLTLCAGEDGIQLGIVISLDDGILVGVVEANRTASSDEVGSGFGLEGRVDSSLPLLPMELGDAPE